MGSRNGDRPVKHLRLRSDWVSASEDYYLETGTIAC